MKRSTLRRRSAKATADDRIYRAAREKVILRSYGRCEARTPACPPGEHEGVHCHHIGRRRGLAPEQTHDPDGMLLLCAAAHQYVHEHIDESVEKGWLRRSWDQPLQT